MKLLVKLLYMPFGIAFGLVGGRAADQLFGVLWSRIDDREPPSPRADDAALGKVVAAAALQAATFAATRAAFDRAGANTFHYLFGAWPVQRRSSESD
jgi:hypothetical protein